MYITFTASRISESNVLFLPTIVFNDEDITIKSPALLHHNTEFIPYGAVSSVHIHTPIAGFSTITFFAYGREISVPVSCNARCAKSVFVRIKKG